MAEGSVWIPVMSSGNNLCSNYGGGADYLVARTALDRLSALLHPF
jgi:hypothetical protein